jgi:ketosteroid isomerase-like protein
MVDPDVEVARRAWAALERKDIDAFLELIDPEIEFLSLIAEAEGRTYRGHDGVRDWWDSVSESLGGLGYDVQEFTSLGEGHVLTEVVITATVADVAVTQTMWQLSEIRGGKAVWWSVFRSEEEARTGAEARRAAG